MGRERCVVRILFGVWGGLGEFYLIEKRLFFSKKIK